MERYVLERIYTDDNTRGKLFNLKKELICFTLELPYLGNKKSISCIPEGIYTVIKGKSDKFGDVFRFDNDETSPRENILIHCGNFCSETKSDSEGCILCGLEFIDINGDKIVDISRSGDAMKKLWSLLPDKFELEIVKEGCCWCPEW